MHLAVPPRSSRLVPLVSALGYYQSTLPAGRDRVLPGPWAGRPGLIVNIMVDDAERAVAEIVRHGSEIVQPIGGDAPETTARFQDPAGNILAFTKNPGHKLRGRTTGRREIVINWLQ